MERAPELHAVQSLKDSSEESWLVPALLWNSSTAFISTCFPPLLEAGGLDGWTSSPVSSVRGSCKQVGAVVWQAAASKARGLLPRSWKPMEMFPWAGESPEGKACPGRFRHCLHVIYSQDIKAHPWTPGSSGCVCG